MTPAKQPTDPPFDALTDKERAKLDPSQLASDGDDVIDGVEPPTDDEIDPA